MKDETKLPVGALALMLLIVLSAYSSCVASSTNLVPEPTPAPISKQGQVCIDCHQKATLEWPLTG